MSPLTMAIIMVILVVICILTKKVPMNWAMTLIPIICCMGLGYSLTQTSDFIIAQLATTMRTVGWMLMFGLIFFNMLGQTGLFETLIGGLVKLVGNKMNVIAVMIMTVIVGGLGFLTANISTTYLICFPLMIPMYKKFKIRKEYAFILCQTAIAAMCFLPWGIGVANSAMMAGTDALTLAEASVPWGLCFIPAIILQIIYFTSKHKKEQGTLGLPADAVEETAQAEKKENPNARPKLFWVNLLIFIVTIFCLAYLKYPAYLVFIIASIVTAAINYPKNWGEMFNKTAMTYYNVLQMMIAISIYIAIFNAAPTDGSKISMVKALADGLVAVFPTVLSKYMYLIFLLLCVVICRFVPYQLLNALYPVFISVGAAFGFTPIQIIAPFVCNLALATGFTPVNTSIYVGAPLSETDVDTVVKMAFPIMNITNVVVILTAIFTGVLKL